MDLAHVVGRLFRGAQIGFGDDFEQRRAGTVQVDARKPAQTLVHGFARVLLEVRARNADALVLAVGILDEQLAVLDDRQLVLADLVALGQVRVEVVLAREDRTRRHGGVDGQPEHGRHAHDFFVEHGQHARVTEVDQASLRVRLGPVRRRGGRENLALRRELRVDLQPDHGFPGATHW